MMGLVKAALGLGVSSVAPNLHLATSNPKLGLTEFEVVLASEATAPPRWLHTVGVSSFGYAGTNSHAVLGDPREARIGAKLESISGLVYRHSIFGWWDDIELKCNAGPASSTVMDPDAIKALEASTSAEEVEVEAKDDDEVTEGNGVEISINSSKRASAGASAECCWRRHSDTRPGQQSCAG